jgi:serine/threonine protein kinase
VPADRESESGKNYLAVMTAHCAALADGLAAVHARGLVHRDISPSNVMLRSGGEVPVLVDFGLAKGLEGTDLTATGELFGKPRYVAPEHARAMKLSSSPSADVYSLGVLAYEMLTLHPPHEGATTLDLVRHAVSRPPRSPRRLNPAIPRSLSNLLLWALEKDPAERVPSAAAFASELRRCLGAQGATRARAGRRAP